MNLQNNKKLKTLIDKYFWAQHPEAALRYLPVVGQLKKLGLNQPKILEIGSGSVGITPYYKHNIDGIDVDFSGPPSKFIKRIKGKAWDLPFKKNEYDVTISVDVLEHIPPNLREKSIYEILRVTKTLAVIVVPTSSESQKQDIELKQLWQKTFNIKNQFLDEHVKYGLPQSEEILVYIDKCKRLLNKKIKITSYPNLNLFVRNLLMRTWITKNKYIYYFYLKGLLLLVPILKYCNFGKTYRKIFVIEFSQ